MTLNPAKTIYNSTFCHPPSIITGRHNTPPPPRSLSFKYCETLLAHKTRFYLFDRVACSIFHKRIKAFLANLLKIIILFVKKYAARKHIIFRAVVLGTTFQFRNFSAVSEKHFRFLKPQYSRNLRAQSILFHKWLTIVVAKADLMTSERAILHCSKQILRSA